MSEELGTMEESAALEESGMSSCMSEDSVMFEESGVSEDGGISDASAIFSQVQLSPEKRGRGRQSCLKLQATRGSGMMYIIAGQRER